MKKEKRKKEKRKKRWKWGCRWERGHTWEAKENLYDWTYSCVCENAAI